MKPTRKLFTEDDLPPNDKGLGDRITIPKGKEIVLQADTTEHERGLLVKWKDDGGYDVAYWYGTPDNVVPAELRGADTPAEDFNKHGESYGDVKHVWLGYHPSIDKTDEGKLTEIKKGDWIRSAYDELGLVNKVKGQTAYVSFDGSRSFDPMRVADLKKTSERHRGKAVYSEAKLEKEKFTEPDQMREGRPMFQDTPNEMAYIDFKKWAYKNRKAVKGILVKAVKDGRDPGTDVFLALRQVWLAWAKKNAKEWSRIPNKDAAGSKFGRALAVMMKKDNLIIKKSGNKLTDMEEGKLTEDYSQRARNFRVNLRTRLEAMKKGQKISYGKIYWIKDGKNFEANNGRKFSVEGVVQALKHAVKPDIKRHRGAAGADMVNAYLKFEGKARRKN